MSQRTYLLPADQYQFGRLCIIIKDDGSLTVLLAGQILHPTGFEDRTFLSKSRRGQPEATVDFALNGEGDVVMTYRCPKAMDEEPDESNTALFWEVTVILHGLNPGKKGFSVSGPIEVQEGPDTFSVVTAVIVLVVIILTVVAGCGTLGWVVNGY